MFAFQEKWMHGVERDAAGLLGSSDVHALPNLAESYTAAADMRLVPFGRDDVLWLVAITAAPLLPLALTMFSFQELLARLVKVLV